MTKNTTKDEPVQELINAITDFKKTLSGIKLKNIAQENLTTQQMSILSTLIKKGPVPMNQLGRELQVTPPNITSIIDRLEKRGLVKRVASTQDRRRTEIQLTPNGKKLYEDASDRYRKYIQKSLKILSPQEQEILTQLLGKLGTEISKGDNYEKVDRRGFEPLTS